jgi:hypothetical protein
VQTTEIHISSFLRWKKVCASLGGGVGGGGHSQKKGPTKQHCFLILRKEICFIATQVSTIHWNM